MAGLLGVLPASCCALTPARPSRTG
jgi:hypothetical protein